MRLKEYLALNRTLRELKRCWDTFVLAFLFREYLAGIKRQKCSLWIYSRNTTMKSSEWKALVILNANSILEATCAKNKITHLSYHPPPSQDIPLWWWWWWGSSVKMTDRQTVRKSPWQLLDATFSSADNLPSHMITKQHAYEMECTSRLGLLS